MNVDDLIPLDCAEDILIKVSWGLVKTYIIKITQKKT